MTTAYAGHTARERKKAETKAKNKGARRQANVVGKCGAKKKGGGLCQMAKGYGTTHYGIGKCKHHGGSTEQSRKAAAKEGAIQFMGAPVDINPLDALIWCIKLTAGEVEFCTQQMEILSDDEWLEHTLVGKQLHVWAKERQKAVDRLAKFSKEALALGIAERAVRLAEQYGTSIAKYTRGILQDLDLTPDQVKKAPLVVRKHLALLEGGSPVSDEDRRELPAIPRRVA